MKWLIKTSIDGKVFTEVTCEGTPCVPETGNSVLVPVNDHYAEAIVSEVEIDRNQHPALLRVTCLTPATYERS